jgi:hypothetical protein
MENWSVCAPLFAQALLARPWRCPRGRVYTRRGLGNVWLTSQEIVDLSLRIVTRIAVAFLNSADQLFGVTLGTIEIVIRQFPPPRFDFAFELMPFSFQDIFVHGVLLSSN